MATIKIPGVTARKNRDGTVRYYRRITKRANGKQEVYYKALPDLASPNFMAELTKINATIKPGAAIQREAPGAGTISALISAFRLTLRDREGQKAKKLSASTLDSWERFLREIDAEHGSKRVAKLEKKHLYEFQDALAATPGKANVHMSCWKVLLEFAGKRGMIAANPAAGMEGRKKGGERQPWPAEVIGKVLEQADDALRLAIISGLYSGQRISDVIRMRPDWIQDGEPPMMVVPGSVKTDTIANIPMVEDWRREIAAAAAINAERGILPMTLIHTRNGHPFTNATELQTRLRKIMRRLGYVKTDAQGRALDKNENVVAADADNADCLYSFHGLSKNAICALTEAGIDETTISAIVGKTVQTVRYYAKETRKWMFALDAAPKVVQGNFGRQAGGKN